MNPERSSKIIHFTVPSIFDGMIGIKTSFVSGYVNKKLLARAIELDKGSVQCHIFNKNTDIDIYRLLQDPDLKDWIHDNYPEYLI